MKTYILNLCSNGTVKHLCYGKHDLRTLCFFILLICLVLFVSVSVLGEESEETILTKGNYEYVLRPSGDAEIVRYNGSEKNLTIPKTLDGHRVTAIRDFAFSPFEDYKLTSVTIPLQVTDIGINPFEDCMVLTRISVAADHPTLMVVDGALYDKRTNTLIACPVAAEAVNVTIASGTRAIGDCAFTNCSRLVSVNLPEGLISIGARAFMECTGLSSVSFPDSLTEIGEDAFCHCASLADITLPGCLTLLGKDAFSRCISLASITIPDSLTDLPHNPFAGCEALKRIGLSATHPTMLVEDGILYDKLAARLVSYPAGRTDTSFTVPSWVREIGAYAFSFVNLTSVTLPEGVVKICTGAFSYCIGLVSVELPESLRSIGDSAFAFCHHLNDVNLPERITQIGPMAFYHCAITALTLPEGITEIDKETFASCPSLMEVSFPATLDRIGEMAFYFCGSLTAISLPEGLTQVDDQAFAWCDSLNAVTLPSSLSRVGKDAFWHSGEDLVFTVPRNGYAEKFCLTYGYTYAYADTPSILVRGGETGVPWILEHPDLHGRTVGRDRMNLYVYWVQVRLKATGRWYQGEEWDCTGNLGSHTMSEINAFMRTVTGYTHDGTVDEYVISMLENVANAPEIRVGGFYDRLNTLTGGDRYGYMTKVDKSSSGDAIRWVQTCLKHLGYYTSAIDGKFGSGTLRALHAFQKKYRWVERDHVSYGVARDLLERYVASGGDPNELP